MRSFLQLLFLQLCKKRSLKLVLKFGFLAGLLVDIICGFGWWSFSAYWFALFICRNIKFPYAFCFLSYEGKIAFFILRVFNIEVFICVQPPMINYLFSETYFLFFFIILFLKLVDGCLKKLVKTPDIQSFFLLFPHLIKGHLCLQLT